MNDIEIKEVLVTYNQYIDKLKQGTNTIINELENDSYNDIEEIFRLVEGMDWIIKVNHLLRQQNIIAEMNFEKIIVLLEEIVSVIEIHDKVALKDILEYELITFLDSLQKYEINIK